MPLSKLPVILPDDAFDRGPRDTVIAFVKGRQRLQKAGVSDVAMGDDLTGLYRLADYLIQVTDKGHGDFLFRHRARLPTLFLDMRHGAKVAGMPEVQLLIDAVADWTDRNMPLVSAVRADTELAALDDRHRSLAEGSPGTAPGRNAMDQMVACLKARDLVRFVPRRHLRAEIRKVQRNLRNSDRGSWFDILEVVFWSPLDAFLALVAYLVSCLRRS